MPRHGLLLSQVDDLSRILRMTTSYKSIASSPLYEPSCTWCIVLQMQQLAAFQTSYCCMQYPMCLSLLEDKKIDVLPMISHRLGFSEEDLAKGFDIALRAAETKAIKVIFKF